MSPHFLPIFLLFSSQSLQLKCCPWLLNRRIKLLRWRDNSHDSIDSIDPIESYPTHTYWSQFLNMLKEIIKMVRLRDNSLDSIDSIEAYYYPHTNWSQSLNISKEIIKIVRWRYSHNIQFIQLNYTTISIFTSLNP